MNTNTSTNQSNRDAAASTENFLRSVDVEQRQVAKRGAINFAEKLYHVLSHKDCRDCITWLPDGKSFCITNKEQFVDTILPKFFKSKASYHSFERRLKTWGFDKIDTSANLYILTHDTFTKTSPHEFELTNGDSFNIIKQLRLVLSNDECQPYIGWLPSGNSFCINHIPNFVKNVMIKYFGENDFGNFAIALKSKGFKRVSVAKFIGESVYSHKMFQLGRPDLCARMERGQEPLPKKKLEYEKMKEKKSKISSISAENGIQEDGKVKANQSLSLTSTENEVSFDNDPSVGAASRFMIPETVNRRPFVSAQRDDLMSTAAFPGSQIAMLNAQMIDPYSTQAHQGDIMQRITSSNPMFQRHITNYPAITNNSDGDFRSIHGMIGLLRNNPGYASLAPHAQSMPPTLRQNNSTNLLKQQMNRESMKAASYYPNMMPQQLKTGSSFRAADGCMPGPDGHGGKSSEELKLAMLEIDSELLKVKELKLLAMQRKLKVQLDMKEKKDDSSNGL